MQFNPDMCEVIRITNKRNPLTNKYFIYDTKFEAINDAKYLKVTVSSDLSWNKHVDIKVKMATRSLNTLKRNLHDCHTGVKDK